MAIGKLEDPRVLELARKSVIASMQRMVNPRTPFSTKIHSGFSARGIPVTSRFLDFVLDDLVFLNIVARSGGMHLSIMTADDLHTFLSAPGFVETISRRALMRFFARPVPSLEDSGLTLRRSGEEGSYTYEIIYKEPESLSPMILEPEEPNLDWMSIPGFDAYIRKQQAVLAGARVGSDQMTVTRYVDSDLIERIDLKIPILTVPDLGCFANISVKDGDITDSWSAATYSRLPDNIIVNHVLQKWNGEYLVLRDTRKKVVKKAPVLEVLDIYLDSAHSEMKKRLADEVALTASVRLKELRVAPSGKAEGVLSEEEKPGWETNVVEDFPLPEVEDLDEDERDNAPLTQQPWMSFVTPEQLSDLKQAQDVVMRLMDGRSLSRGEMFGSKPKPSGWRIRFCSRLKEAGILTCIGSHNGTRWTATSEILDRLSSIEQLIPFVFTSSEIHRYEFLREAHEAAEINIPEHPDDSMEEEFMTDDVDHLQEDEPVNGHVLDFFHSEITVTGDATDKLYFATVYDRYTEWIKKTGRDRISKRIFSQSLSKIIRQTTGYIPKGKVHGGIIAFLRIKFTLKIPPVSHDTESETIDSPGLEARVEELEDLVQQQNTMILNLTKQMTVMIGHWQDLKKETER